MAVTAQPLFQAYQAAASEVAIYVSTNGKTIIDKFTGTNTTASAASLTVKLIASGGSAGASNTIVSAKVIQPGECYTFPEVVGHVLNAGDSISVLAGTATAITLRASGRLVT